MGLEKAERIYEELSDAKKLKNVLQDVSILQATVVQGIISQSFVNDLCS